MLKIINWPKRGLLGLQKVMSSPTGTPRSKHVHNIKTYIRGTESAFVDRHNLAWHAVK